LDQGIEGIDNWDAQPPVAITRILVIEDQLITCEMLEWFSGWTNDHKPWTGTGEFFIQFQCYPPKDLSNNVSHYVYSEDGTNPKPVDIKDAVTTLEWSRFIWIRDSNAG
jgi:hypothetical protein